MAIFHYLVHVKNKNLFTIVSLNKKQRMYITIMYTSLYVRVITSVFCCVEQISFLFNIVLERRCMMKVKIHRMKIDVPSEVVGFHL